MNYYIDKLLLNIRRGGLIRKLYELTILKRIANSETRVFRKQERLLKEQLLFSINHCRWYSKVKLNTNNLLSSFPLLSREDVINHIDELCSDMKEHRSYGVGYTGGSTGVPLKLYVSGGYEKVFGKKRWKHYGYKKGEVILACDGTKIPDDSLQKGIYWYKKNPEDVPFGSWGLSSLYLTDDNAVEYCNFIKRLKPNFLRGYPSFIYSLVCYAETHHIEMGATIKAVELTSESAFSYQIEKIKKVLNAKVYLQYGHTESCICAYSYDDTYRYRCEPLYGFVEILDENGQHVQIGEIGEVVVTSLYNRAMPLIRYQTGDYAEYGGKDNRYVYLNKVLGRTQDYIVNSNGEKVLLTALIFGQHFKAMEHIQKWQIEQTAVGEVVISVIKGQGYSDKDEQEVYNVFDRLGNVHSIFRYVEEIPLTPRGKSKMLIQHLL